MKGNQSDTSNYESAIETENGDSVEETSVWHKSSSNGTATDIRALSSISQDSLNSLISFRDKELASSPALALQYPLPEDVLVYDLLRVFSLVNNWDVASIQQDTRNLLQVRIRTVGDLRLVPKKSWSSLPVPLVVSELLRRMAWEGLSSKAHGEELMKKCLQSFNLQRQTASSAILDAQNHTSLVQPTFSNDNLSKCELDPTDTPNLIRQLLYNGKDPQTPAEPYAKESPQKPRETKINADEKTSEELVHLLLNTNLVENTPVPTSQTNSLQSIETGRAKLGVCANNPNRIRVSGTANQIYEIDRFCPHKNYDMLNAAPLNGSIITCPKHKWSFDLSNGGVCVDRPGKSLNCSIIDW